MIANPDKPGRRLACLTLATAALALQGCGESPATRSAPASPTPTPSTPAGQAPPAAPGSAANAFIGSLAVDPGDDTVFLGTGFGLFRVKSRGKKADRVVGELRTPDGSGPVSSNLVVRFAGAGELLASGHPEAGGSALPEDLGLIRSIDGGGTWEPVSELGRADFHILQVAGDRVVAVAVEARDIKVSNDGGRTFNARTAPSVPVDVAFDPSEPRQMIVTTAQGVYTSSDEGETWRQRDNVASEQLAWAASGPVYRSDPGGFVKVSHDGGKTWQDRGSVRLSIHELALDAHGSLYASLPGGQVQRSTDGGATWDSLIVLK